MLPACESSSTESTAVILLGMVASRLSLKYHPDKNKAKNAEAKFSEISNGE